MDSYSEYLDRVNNGSHFSNYNHMRVTRLEGAEAEGVLEIRPDSLNPAGIVHGGALVALADTVCGTAAFSTGQSCVTLDCSMQYLAPAKGARIFCAATPRKLGRTIMVYDAALTDEGGRLVAAGTNTFYATGPVDLNKLD